MGLLYALKQIGQGNFENAFNGIWVSDDLLAAQDAAGDNLSKIIQQEQAKGLVDAQTAQQLYSDMAPNTNSDAYWSQSGDTPLDVFNKTLEEQASAIGQFGSSAINKITGLGFKIIPWQVWILLLVLVMVWLYPLWRPFASTLMKKK